MMSWYRPILALHVIAIISWMAGILYLYRLLIYASERGQENPTVKDLLQTMSRRLLKAITIPAMIVSWIAGLMMIYLQPALMSSVWFQIKFACVIGVSAATMHAAKQTRLYGEDKPILAGKTLRFLNEVPTILMIIIVVMVIVRPWV